MSVSSSSAAVLAEAFDFNLHLEDSPTNKYFQMQHLFRFTAVVLSVILIWSLSFSSGFMIWQSPHIIQYNNPKIDDMNASFVNYRSKIDDMNSLYSSKINDMNSLYRSKIDDMNSLFNTRVNSINEAITVLKSEISNSNKEKIKLMDIKPVQVESAVNISALNNQITEQSHLLFKLNELHLTTAQTLEEIRTKQNKYDQISTTSTETQERIKQFYSRIETMKIQQESMKVNQESLFKQQELIKMQQSVPSISSNISIESHRIFLLLNKIQILEERMSKAIHTANASINTSDIVIENQNDVRYYDSLAETVINRIWDENKESYKSSFVPEVCPMQITNDVNNDENVTPNVIATLPYSSLYSTYDDIADFAGKLSGGKIIYKETSETYSYPMDNSNTVSSYFNEFLKTSLGLDPGVGVPEDIISSDMSLGSCWPMKGSEGMITIKLARKIKIDSISIDHISRYSAIDVSTAPKSFNVYGSISDSKSDFKLLLNGNYSISKEPSQNFVINGSKDELVEESIQFVSLQILNNHGNSNYTCLYRFRVHGVPV